MTSRLSRVEISRRRFLQASAAGAGGLAAWSVLGGSSSAQAATAAAQVVPFNSGWLFGRVYKVGSEQPGYDDSAFMPVTTPHTVRPLSWRNWDFEYENVWIYRHHFDAPAASAGNRTFVDFQGAMTSATPTINGATLAEHRGGYLPFSCELTDHLVATDNVLAVKLNANWQQVPPDGATAASGVPNATKVDFMEPAGLYRDVQLRIVPQVFIADVWANPVDVLTASTRRVRVQSVVDAAGAQTGVTLNAALFDPGNTLVTQRSATVSVAATGRQTVTIVLDGNLSGVTLWSPGNPALYRVVVTLSVDGVAQHTFTRSIGFRTAEWNTNGGFYLNGNRFELFGLSRHQLFPYVGMAAPARAQRFDADLLRRTLNCNMVRMVHYPHSPDFLDQCDRIGLLVWEEIPGWGYLPETNTSWTDLMKQNTADMVTRDRNHPSIIIWGVQVNESQLDTTTDGLYAQTRDIANGLDGSRATSGAAKQYNPDNWVQPVRTHNDYSHSSDHMNASLQPPIAGSPYLVTEAVGALTGAGAYRLTDGQFVQQLQARQHAQVVDAARGDSRYAGVTPWAGIDYQSAQAGESRIWQRMKWTGVVDTHRILKHSAAVYRAQRPLTQGPTLFPAFDWDFGANSVKSLGTRAYVFSNCTSIQAFLDGTLYATLAPNTAGFPNLLAPPFFLDTSGVNATSPPELRLDGYDGMTLVVSKTFSPDTSGDRLQVSADDASIVADGSDATRVSFMIVDKHGNRRANSAGNVTISISGPGTWGTGKLSLLTMSASPAVLTGPGQSSTVTATLTNGAFELGDAGGAGAIWIHGMPNVVGTITVTVTHPILGSQSVTIAATAPAPAVEAAPPLETSLRSGSLSLSLPSGWTSTAITPTTFASLVPGDVFRASWTVTAPANLTITNTAFLEAQAAYTVRTQPVSDGASLPLGIGTSFADAFNNVGISADASPCTADLDAFGNSYSAAGLAGAGLGRGAAFSHNGIHFVMPDAAPGTRDNVVCEGQVILLSGTGQKIGFVGASTGGTQQAPDDGAVYGTGLDGQVSVIYADGTVTTTQVVDLATSNSVMASQFIVDDWKLAPGRENDNVVVLSSYNSCKNGSVGSPSRLVYAAVPLIAGKAVQAVVLPTGGTAKVGIHLFAVGLDTPS